MKKLVMLFATFFKIGLFTFGGGYAMLSLIQAETVTKKQWLGADELLNIIAISESTPGPISINCATYIGFKRAGVLGAIFATLGVVLPSFIIIFAISFFIERFLSIEIVGKAFRGIQAAVAVLILRAGFKMSKGFKRDVMSFALLFLAIAFMITLNFVSFDLSSIYLIIFGGLVGLIVGLIKNKKPETEALQPSPISGETETHTSINGETQENETTSPTSHENETETRSSINGETELPPQENETELPPTPINNETETRSSINDETISGETELQPTSQESETTQSPSISGETEARSSINDETELDKTQLQPSPQENELHPTSQDGENETHTSIIDELPPPQQNETTEEEGRK